MKRKFDVSDTESESDVGPPAKRFQPSTTTLSNESLYDNVFGVSDKENNDQEMIEEPPPRRDLGGIFASCVPLHYHSLEEHIRDEQRLIDRKLRRFFSAIKNEQEKLAINGNSAIAGDETSLIPPAVPQNGPMACLTTTSTTTSVTPSSIPSVVLPDFSSTVGSSLPTSGTQSTSLQPSTSISLPQIPSTFNFSSGSSSGGAFNFSGAPSSSSSTTAQLAHLNNIANFNQGPSEGQTFFSMGTSSGGSRKTAPKGRKRR